VFCFVLFCCFVVLFCFVVVLCCCCVAVVLCCVVLLLCCCCVFFSLFFSLRFFLDGKFLFGSFAEVEIDLCNPNASDEDGFDVSVKH